MLRLFLKLNEPRQNTVCVLKNARDLLEFTQKTFLLKDLATFFKFISKIPYFYWLCIIAFLIRNNEPSKTSNTKKGRKLKSNKIQRKYTAFSYKKECVFILF